MGMYFCPFFLFLCFCNIVLCCLLALEFGFVAVFLIFIVLNLRKVKILLSYFFVFLTLKGRITHIPIMGGTFLGLWKTAIIHC